MQSYLLRMCLKKKIVEEFSRQVPMLNLGYNEDLFAIALYSGKKNSGCYYYCFLNISSVYIDTYNTTQFKHKLLDELNIF